MSFPSNTPNSLVGAQCDGVVIFGGGTFKEEIRAHAQSCLTQWARQTPLSMGFSSQESWSELLFPSPKDLPDPGIEPGSPALQADFFFFFLLSEPPGKPSRVNTGLINWEKWIKHWNFGKLVSEREQNMAPWNMHLCYIDHFEWVIFKKSKTWEELGKLNRSYLLIRNVYIYKGNVHL